MRNSAAICGIANVAVGDVRSPPMRMPGRLSALTEAWTGLRARVVSSCEEYDTSRHFDVLLTDADGTYTVSFASADRLPWPLRR